MSHSHAIMCDERRAVCVCASLCVRVCVCGGEGLSLLRRGVEKAPRPPPPAHSTLTADLGEY